MIVHKFGGTSVGDAQRFANVAEIVSRHHNQSSTLPPNWRPTAHARSSGLEGTVVVVSAMSKVTDMLIAGARAAVEGQDNVYHDIKAALLDKHLVVVEKLLAGSPERHEIGGFLEDRLNALERLYRSIAILGEFTKRGSDAVASLGEQLSSNLLAAVLRSKGVRAEAISATELVVTDANFGAAEPRLNLTRQRMQERVRPLIERGVIPVITGFIAATENGVTTTLGRGGSDYTAAIVGACLDADEVWIWSDVDGILTADPGIVPQARTLAELSYAEAAELAYYGAEVLHPKTIRPVTENNIPLRILNTFNPTHPGTLIVANPSADRKILPAIISTTGLTMIAVGTRDDSWGLQMAARVLQQLGEAGVDIQIFSQSISEHSLNMVVREQNQAHCLHVLTHVFGGELPGTFDGSDGSTPTGQSQGKEDGAYCMGIKEKVATISIVGIPGWNDTGIVSHAFGALGKHGVRIIAVVQAGTENSVSFCIPEDMLEGTVSFLHGEFGLGGKS